MDISLKSWAVLYSFSQDMYQIETLEDMVRNNRVAKVEGRPVDFVVLDIVENKEKADELFRQYRGRNGA